MPAMATITTITTIIKHNTMHRVYRNDMTQAQRSKISAANIGKRLSQSTKNKISRSMQQYWEKLPYKPGTEADNEQQQSPYEE